MTASYFLGANSRRGFCSLYGDFASAPGDVLHVIKGGPGTGKSGLMRRIAEAAEARGYGTELVLCSGDPDSLDGVYIPALHQAWMDGTAPHIADPAHFGADGDYVDLGRFCRLPLPESDRERVFRLNAAYKLKYAAAYRFLAAAGALHASAGPAPWDDAAEERLRRRLRGILQRSARRGECGGETRRFLSAISCRGLLRLPLPQAYARVYRFDTDRGLAPRALRIAAEEAAGRGLARILCLSPLDPEEPEALLLPGAGLAFLSGDLRAENPRGIRLDALLPPPEREQRTLRRRIRRMESETLESAVGSLREAKALHDELESVYRPRMDFAALTEFTGQLIEKTFG